MSTEARTIPAETAEPRSADEAAAPSARMNRGRRYTADRFASAIIAAGLPRNPLPSAVDIIVPVHGAAAALACTRPGAQAAMPRLADTLALLDRPAR